MTRLDLYLARPNVRPLNVATFRQNVVFSAFAPHSGEVQLRLTSGRARYTPVNIRRVIERTNPWNGRTRQRL